MKLMADPDALDQFLQKAVGTNLAAQARARLRTAV